MLGAFAAFGLARRFGRPLTERLVPRRHLARLDGWAERGGLAGAAGRPLPADDRLQPDQLHRRALARELVDLAWTTGLGILPVTVLMAALGGFDRLPWTLWLLLAAVAVGLLLWLGRAAHRLDPGTSFEKRSLASLINLAGPFGPAL